MCHGRQVKLQVNRKRFGYSGNGTECVPLPKASGPKHRKNHFLVRTSAERGPERRELVIGSMVKEMRVVCPIDAMKMKAKKVRAFGIQSFDLSLVQIRNERQMIIFRKVNELKFLPFGFQEFRGSLKQSCVALKFALMIARSQARIFNMEFLCVPDCVEFLSEPAVGEQDALIRYVLAPIRQHLSTAAADWCERSKFRTGVMGSVAGRRPIAIIQENRISHSNFASDFVCSPNRAYLSIV